MHNIGHHVRHILSIFLFPIFNNDLAIHFPLFPGPEDIQIILRNIKLITFLYSCSLFIHMITDMFPIK